MHATYPRDTLAGLETMSMMSDIDMPLSALRMQIASAVNLVAQVSRLSDGPRKITHVSEIIGYDPQAQTCRIEDVFSRHVDGVDPDGTIHSRLLPTGYLPRCAPQLAEHGVALPASVHQAAQQAAERRARPATPSLPPPRS